MRITLELTPDTVKKLMEQAEARRVTLDEYLETIIERVSHTGLPYELGDPRPVRTLADGVEALRRNQTSSARPSSPRRKKTDKYFN